MDNEFNKSIKETNDFPEYQSFSAVEYYKQKEIADSPAEVLKYPEQYDSTTTDSNSRIKEFKEDNSYDKLEQKSDDSRAQNQAQEKYQTNTGGSEEIQATTTAEVEASSSAASSTSSAAAGASASSAAVASSASLAGVTILAAAAVVAVGGSTAIALPDPLVDLTTATYEVGTDYLVYDLDIKGLSSGIDYYIDIKDINGKLIEAYPVKENGHIRRIVSGLIPNTPYDIRLYTRDSTFHDLVYYTARCNTTYDTNPKAIFNAIPNIDYEMGTYSLDFEVYISDYTKVLQDAYLEMFVNNQNRNSDYVLEDNYFRFNVSNLRNEAKVSGIAYGMVAGEGNNAQAANNQILVLGSYEYDVQFPDDFVFNEDRSFAQYDFDIANFSYDFAESEGNILNIYTGFDNVLDPRDLYRITVLDNELNEITSIESSDPSVSLTLEPMYDYITVRMTLLKMLEDQEVKELESEEVDYIIPNEFLSNIQFGYDEFGYHLTGIGSEILGNNPSISFEIHLKDGTVIPMEGEVSLDYDYSFTYNQEFEGIMSATEDSFKEIEYISATVENDGLRYGYYKTRNIEGNVESYEVLDSGSILLNYNIELPQGANFVSAMIGSSSDAQISESAYENLSESGQIELLNLYSNKVSLYVNVTYEINGVRYNSLVELKQDFDVDVDLDWFGMYAYSGLYAFEKVNSTIDGKPVNSQFDVNVMIYDDFEGQLVEKNHLFASSYNIGNYYGIEFNDGQNKKIDYTIKLNDEDSIEGTMMYNSDGTLEDRFDSKYYVDYKIMDQEVYYTSNRTPYFIKTYNSDGTINLHIYTGFEDTSTENLFGQFFILSENSGGINTVLSEETIVPYIEFNNLPDTYYEIQFNAGFKDADGVKWFPREAIKLNEFDKDSIPLDSTNQSLNISSGPVTEMTFTSLDVFDGNTVNLIVEGESYPVEIIRDYTDSRVDGDVNDFSYQIVNGDYTVDVMASRNYNNYRIYTFKITLNGIEAKIESIEYTYSPQFFLEYAPDIDISSLKEEKLVDVFKYQGEFYLDELEINYYDSDAYQITGLSFNKGDDYGDCYIIVAEWERLMTTAVDGSFSAEVDYYTLEPITNLVAGELYYTNLGDYYSPYIPTTNENDVTGYYVATKVSNYETPEYGNTYYTTNVGKTGVLSYDSEAMISINGMALTEEVTFYIVELKEVDYYTYIAYDKFEIGKIND